jgi:hypothetical protein
MNSPAVALMAFQTTAVGPNALRIAETLLGLLADAGVDQANAAWAIDMLTMLVTAVAAEHAHGSGPGAPDGPVTQAINRAPANEYPRVHAARTEIMSGTGDERVRVGGRRRHPRHPLSRAVRPAVARLTRSTVSARVIV